MLPPAAWQHMFGSHPKKRQPTDMVGLLAGFVTARLMLDEELAHSKHELVAMAEQDRTRRQTRFGISCGNYTVVTGDWATGRDAGEDVATM